MLLKLVTWPAAATLLSQPAISVLALQKGYSTYTPALPPLAPIRLKAKQEFCKSKLLYHQCTAVKTSYRVALIKCRPSCTVSLQRGEPGITTPSPISLFVFSKPPLGMALPHHSVQHLLQNSTMHMATPCPWKRKAEQSHQEQRNSPD